MECKICGKENVTVVDYDEFEDIHLFYCYNCKRYYREISCSDRAWRELKKDDWIFMD